MYGVYITFTYLLVTPVIQHLLMTLKSQMHSGMPLLSTYLGLPDQRNGKKGHSVGAYSTAQNSGMARLEGPQPEAQRASGQGRRPR